MSTPDQMMPRVINAPGKARSARELWVTELEVSAYADMLYCTDAGRAATVHNHGGQLKDLFLTEAQARSLHAQLETMISDWDRGDLEEDRLRYRRRLLADVLEGAVGTTTFRLKVCGPVNDTKYFNISRAEFDRIAKVVAPH